MTNLASVMTYTNDQPLPLLKTYSSYPLSSDKKNKRVPVIVNIVTKDFVSD